MSISTDHFLGCHQEDDKAPDHPDGHIAQDTEQCWHCHTPTDMGCYCLGCFADAQYIQPGSVYHCKLCGRWWAYVSGINILGTEF